MRNPIRPLTLTAVGAASLLLSLALLATPALATHFQSESYGELLAQIHRREVIAVVLHPQGYKAHASATGGRHFTIAYTPAEVPQLRAAAHTGNASFTTAVSKHKTAAVHHKLRYIAGGVLIVVIVVVLVVLLIGRRRALEDEGPGSGGEAASAPPAA